jgi:hypothetical protein
VLQALKNPAYAGAYTYGRSYDKRRVQPDGTVRSARRKRARDEWTVLIQDHHEGYISWQQFLDNEAKLAANHTARGARPPREGNALCQGIIYCGACGARMGTRYGNRHYVFYVCTSASDQASTTDCRSVAMSTVDDVVSRLLLEAVTPEQITAALAVADEVTERHVRSHRAAELTVERARYEADRAERAFSQVEPENRLVARSLESRWETKLVALAEAEAALETARAAKPPLPPRSTLEALAADLPRLWDDPDTSPKDRKRLLRTLIADITLLPIEQRGQVRIGVRWHTGATNEITVDRKGPGRTPTTAVEIISRYGAVKTSAQLADQLNTAGLATGKGRPWDTAAVARVRDVYGIPAPRTAAVQAGEVSIAQAAAQLGVAPKAVGNWIRKGQLPARRGAAGRWCILWDEATQQLYRQQVKRSFRVKRTTPTTAGGAV